VGAPSSPVGVDFEDMGRIQRPELIVETLTAAERHSVNGLSGTALDERLLRLWCAKEAAAKYLGLGLQGRPEAFEVHFADESFTQAVVGFEASRIQVGIVREGQTVIAVAADERSGTGVH